MQCINTGVAAAWLLRLPSRDMCYQIYLVCCIFIC